MAVSTEVFPVDFGYQGIDAPLLGKVYFSGNYIVVGKVSKPDGVHFFYFGIQLAGTSQTTQEGPHLKVLPFQKDFHEVVQSDVVTGQHPVIVD